MKILKFPVLFCLGGSAYVGLELLYRGYSHVSMFCAGGLCFLLIGQVGRLCLPPVVQAVLGSVIITAVELATGLLVNRNYQIWDYRGQPGNFLGQICPRFCLLWTALAALALCLYRWAEPGLDRLLKT